MELGTGTKFCYINPRLGFYRAHVKKLALDTRKAFDIAKI